MATIYDVARAANVTAATVSNVLTGKGAVGQETRRRVEAAIADLGYQPNLLARALATRQTLTLGLVLPTIANPFYPEIALEVEHTARVNGYALFLCNTSNEPRLGQMYLQGLASRAVGGVVVMPGGIDLEDLLVFAGRNLPLVLCNWEEQDELPPLPMVGVNFSQGAALAADHLLSLGHRRIGLIADASVPHTRHTERVAGFAAVLAAAGIPWDPTLVRVGDSSLESGRIAADALLDLPQPPTAIFCTNDLMALGTIDAANAHDVRIPDDLSLVGFDDIMIGAHTQPPLTTVAVPKREIGVRATLLLLDWVRTGEMPAASPVHIDAELRARRSTAPLAGSPRPTRDRPAATQGLDITAYRHLLDALPGQENSAPRQAMRRLDSTSERTVRMM